MPGRSYFASKASSHNPDPDATPPGAFALAPGGVVEPRSLVEWNVQEQPRVLPLQAVGNGYLLNHNNNNGDDSGSDRNEEEDEQDVEQPELVTATPNETILPTASDTTKAQQRRKLHWMGIAIMAILASVALIVGLTMGCTVRHKQQPATIPREFILHTQDEFAAPPGRKDRATMGLQHMVQELVLRPAHQYETTTTTIDSLLQPNWTSPHYQALYWLLYLDPILQEMDATTIQNDTSVTLLQVQQRYILALLYFQTSWKPHRPHRINRETFFTQSTSTWKNSRPPSMIDLYYDHSKTTTTQHHHQQWLTGTSECNWAGIQCNQDGQLTHLELVDAGLVNTLPVELAVLSHMQVLRLGSNPELGGSSPLNTYLSAWHEVQEIDVSYNQHTGYSVVVVGPLLEEHPATIIESKSLRVLNMAGNNLTDILPSTWVLPQLERLELQGNQFHGGIPQDQWWQHLAALRYLDLSGNTHLFSTTTTTTNNNTTSHNKDIVLPRSLQHLDLSSTHLPGRIPSHIFSLTQLTTLRLADNRLTGTLSPGIGTLVRLQQLDLSSNDLTGRLPSTLGHLSDIRSFHVQDNHFTGAVPQAFCELGQGFPLATYTDVVMDCATTSSSTDLVESNLTCPSGCCTQCCSKTTGICELETSALMGLTVDVP